MFETHDQLERRVILQQYPLKRIISLVPSQTELLHDLGLEEEVIGITKFCVYPQSWFKTKERMGGTKTVNIQKIKELKPDLVLANKEENVKEQIEALETVAPVWVSDINNVEDALQMIERVGELTDKSEKSKVIIQNIQYAFSKLQTVNYKLQTVYLIWQHPYMTVGGDTFINDMLNKCGLQNMFENEKRYPHITTEQLVALQPQLVLLSSEPFPFKQKHADEIKALLPKTKVLLVDGEMFSWYGSRMLYTTQYFKELMNKIFEPPAKDFAV